MPKLPLYNGQYVCVENQDDFIGHVALYVALISSMIHFRMTPELNHLVQKRIIQVSRLMRQLIEETPDDPVAEDIDQLSRLLEQDVLDLSWLTELIIPKGTDLSRPVKSTTH